MLPSAHGLCAGKPRKANAPPRLKNAKTETVRRKMNSGLEGSNSVMAGHLPRPKNHPPVPSD